MRTYSSTSSLVRLVKRRPTSPLRCLLTCKEEPVRGTWAAPRCRAPALQFHTATMTPPTTQLSHCDNGESQLKHPHKGHPRKLCCPSTFIPWHSCHGALGHAGKIKKTLKQSPRPLPCADSPCTRCSAPVPAPPSSLCSSRRRSWGGRRKKRRMKKRRRRRLRLSAPPPLPHAPAHLLCFQAFRTSLSLLFLMLATEKTKMYL